MTPPLSLAQRLGLVKFFTESLATLRTKELLPLAGNEMPSGSRLPIMFGGQFAGWASMPEPSRRAAFVSDESKLLAWAKANHPDKVEPTEEVIVDSDLIAFLADNYPQALRKGERVSPVLLGDLLASMRDPGWYHTKAGEKLTEIPGITVPETAPAVPRVDLDKEHAAGVIGAAWRDGLIPASELLALPAPPAVAEAPAASFVVPEEEAAPGRCSSGQRSMIGAQFATLGIRAEGDELAAASLLAGRRTAIASLAELTGDEAGRVRDALRACQDSEALAVLLAKLGRTAAAEASASASTPGDDHRFEKAGASGYEL